MVLPNAFDGDLREFINDACYFTFLLHFLVCDDSGRRCSGSHVEEHVMLDCRVEAFATKHAVV